MRIVFLGTGTSYGTPMIGCDCMVCKSDDPKNKRLRSSIQVSYNGRSVMIDTSPDLRLQVLNNGVNRVDAILFTHYHADHLFGLDDVRIFNSIQKSPISCYSSASTIDFIRKSFHYIFDPDTPRGGGLPELNLCPVEETFSLFDEDVVPVPVMHGDIDILGFRWDKFAYITDCSYMTDSSIKLVEGVDILALNALRYRPHITHNSISDSLELIKRIKPKKAYLTHMSHDVEHETVNKTLPDGINLAYDGLVLDV